MTTRYITPSVEAILEDSEDEVQLGLRDQVDHSSIEAVRLARIEQQTMPRPSTGKEKERHRRHRSCTSGSKQQSKSKPKSTSGRRATRTSCDVLSESRHRRILSGHSNSSASSSDDDQVVQDHRTVLAAARARLISPSMISTHTALTNSTNQSSGSSGSNSTVTQASITKQSRLGKKPEVGSPDKPPMSPAVPDPPNVFAFLEADCSFEPAMDAGMVNGREESKDEDGGHEDLHTQLPPTKRVGAFTQPDLPQRLLQDHTSSSSSSSSHHGDDSSSPVADNDTDRSTSPERSLNCQGLEYDPSITDRASVKIASQIAAAQHRQDLYDSMQHYGTPNMPRGSTEMPHIPFSALSQRHYHCPSQHTLPRAEKLPVTGYELLASRLSGHDPDDDEIKIKPMYRKFEALNHRLLLHLQDEILELEEQLHRLDHADTQSRKTNTQIAPASRRRGVMTGGELHWHKTDVLGRIGYKLAQYNQALSSFNTTQSLSSPAPDDILAYRAYLQTENPIAEPETHFLDPISDLVSLYSDHVSQSTPSLSYSPSMSSVSSISRHRPTSSSIPDSASLLGSGNRGLKGESLTGLATAVAVSVLVPILTYSVIPGFVGRLTVTALVSIGIIGALLQSRVLRQWMLLENDAIMCLGIYGGVMIIIAAIMA